MAPLISIGATMPVWRRPAINVTVSQLPIGASLTKRSPHGFQPLSLIMLVVTAVSSINTRRAGSRNPCSRIQRRRARATSARFRSAARRLFFNGDAMASKKSGERAAAARDSPLVKRRNDLIQREVRFLADEGEDLPRVLLHCDAAGPGGGVPRLRRGRSRPGKFIALDSWLDGIPASNSLLWITRMRPG